MQLRWMMVLVLAALVVSCATDEAHRYYKTLPPKDVAEVELLWANPARKFTVIADLQGRRMSPYEMQVLAAEAGADAVIVTTMGAVNYTRSENTPREPDARSSYTRIVGTAITYDHGER